MNKSEWVKIAMERFQGRLLRYTSRFVPESQAREIVQEAFLKLWQQHPEEIDPYLAEWLFKVCRHHAIDLQRKEKHLSRVDEPMKQMESLKDDTPDPETRVQNAKLSTQILRSLDRLPANQQEVIRLKFQEDLSYKQIAAITGHSVSHVGVLIHTAITSLRARLEVKS